ncbi:hypothetical protein [Pontibacterium sp.]|uniref:hypothetical protein n=1 Tax=Pontibacterium sp. TaxID=2036026 RepID=UPI0035658B4F
MLSILHDLEAYSGAQHSGVSSQGNLIASTCPADLQQDLVRSQQVVSQLFNGINECGHSYAELHLELDRHLLLAYRLSEDCTLLMLTRKGVNMALMATSVRSVKKRILGALTKAAELPSSDLQPVFPVGETGFIQAGSAQHQEDAAALSELMNKLCDKMVDTLGSTGAISFYRILNEWKRQYGMNKYKLPALLKLLAVELEAGAPRDAFLKEAVVLTRELVHRS